VRQRAQALVGRAYYAASTLICTPCSLAQEVGLALGAQAGEARMRSIVTGAGFGRFRRAMHTSFNLIFEARPLTRPLAGVVIINMPRTQAFGTHGSPGGGL